MEEQTYQSRGLKVNYGYQYPAGLIITNTATHTGRFGKVHCLTDAEATFVAENITENGSATINGITMKASSEVCGVITSITLASGQVIAYFL